MCSTGAIDKAPTATAGKGLCQRLIWQRDGYYPLMTPSPLAVHTRQSHFRPRFINTTSRQENDTALRLETPAPRVPSADAFTRS
jgi:hypothetical protein